MDLHLSDWLNLALRWAHLIAGISWIGNSFYFMWLDSHLAAPNPPDAKVEGSLWMVHSGGFYQVERRKIFPGEMPKLLHWFKWEATLTWVSGFFLMGLIYYLSNGLYLLDPGISNWSVGKAVSISLGLFVVSWFFYDFFMETRWGQSKRWSLPVLLGVLGGLTYWLSHNLSGRATFIQVGAIMGTIMVLNVWVRILPAQSKMIAATDRGETPDYQLSKAAKTRSTHNSYMTLPVLFMMVSNHYPFLFGHSQNWILILLLFVLGAGFRHLLLKGFKARWSLLPIVAAAITLVGLTASRNSEPTSALGNGSPVDFVQVQAIVESRCLSCHSDSPGDPSFGAAPGGVSFDQAENIRRMASRILVRAVQDKTMPLANKTQMTDDERAILGRWIAQGGGAQ